MNCNCHGHSSRNSLRNKICMGQFSNDYICQNVNTIYCKHNIFVLLWWLEKWCWENMSLFMQKMEPDIRNNESKKSQTTSCVVVCFSSWTQHNRCISIKSMGWPHIHWKIPWAGRQGSSNLVHNVEDKMFWKSSLKMND